MMKPIQRKQDQYKIVIIFLAVVSLFMSWGIIGHAQETQRGGAKISRYEMDGRLQAFNLDERWALIGGFKWSLADTFDAKEFATRLGLGKTGTVKFTPKQKSWATYYVILQTIDASSVVIKGKEMDRNAIKLVVDPNETKKIYEQGGKIYKIVPCGE